MVAAGELELTFAGGGRPTLRPRRRRLSGLDQDLTAGCTNTAIFVAHLLPDVVGQDVEVPLELRILAIVEVAVRHERPLLRFDRVQLTIQAPRFAVGQPAVVVATLDPCADAGLALVDVLRAIVPALVAPRGRYRYCTGCCCSTAPGRTLSRIRDRSRRQWRRPRRARPRLQVQTESSA
jgi:hypothetical protein